ncbi:cytochrome c oxidase subunit 5A, mitochondrial-like [Dendronephthya gigantea]|uniref:cytochrome c oxidase subunit 5A, mitochondrial-like n=1 Tax=Dendronephthya gigantea TaxID=151771 RepID=UPI00106C523A|nr:cytochrome c oxidase subunit 5A, mitochondrial-like [Dendronephthya gigantea]
MLRSTLSRLAPAVRQIRPVLCSSARFMSDKPVESAEAFDARWEAYFNREDIDDWELRKGVNELYGHDLVPEPRIVNAMLRACRRQDDFGMAIRVLEMVKLKSRDSGDNEIYNYIIQNCKPVMEELGIETVEDLGLA